MQDADTHPRASSTTSAGAVGLRRGKQPTWTKDACVRDRSLTPPPLPLPSTCVTLPRIIATPPPGLAVSVSEDSLVVSTPSSCRTSIKSSVVRAGSGIIRVMRREGGAANHDLVSDASDGSPKHVISPSESATELLCGNFNVDPVTETFLASWRDNRSPLVSPVACVTDAGGQVRRSKSAYSRLFQNAFEQKAARAQSLSGPAETNGAEQEEQQQPYHTPSSLLTRSASTPTPVNHLQVSPRPVLGGVEPSAATPPADPLLRASSCQPQWPPQTQLPMRPLDVTLVESGLSVASAPPRTSSRGSSGSSTGCMSTPYQSPLLCSKLSNGAGDGGGASSERGGSGSARPRRLPSLEQRPSPTFHTPPHPHPLERERSASPADISPIRKPAAAGLSGPRAGERPLTFRLDDGQYRQRCSHAR